MWEGEEPSAKLLLGTADLRRSKQVWYPASQPFWPTTAEALIAERARSMSAVTMEASCLYSVLRLPDLAPVPGANLVSKLTFKPGTNLSTTSTVVLSLQFQGQTWCPSSPSSRAPTCPQRPRWC